MKISWTDRLRNEEVLQGKRGEGMSCIQWQGEGYLIGHILRRNCFLKHLIEGKLKGKREDMERGVRRHKQLFDDQKEKRGY